jgi:hypothetical protein
MQKIIVTRLVRSKETNKLRVAGADVTNGQCIVLGYDESLDAISNHVKVMQMLADHKRFPDVCYWHFDEN